MRPKRDGRHTLLAIGLFLSACSAPPASDSASNTPNGGANTAASDLDALAAESGVISENRTDDASGSYGRSYEGGDDRLCLTRAGDSSYRAAVEIRIGEEEYCRGSGILDRDADGLVLRLAQGRCVIPVRDEGDRLVLPGAVDAACASLCSARGSLAGVTFPRVASGDDAARRVLASDGKPLCGG